MACARPVVARALHSFAFAAFSGLLIVGCGGSDTTGPGGGGPPVVTTLACADPSGGFSQCDLELGQPGGFTITLTTNSCDAHGNELVLTQPALDTLARDGCYTAQNTSWPFAGPYAAGTKIGFSIVSAKLQNPSALHVTGAYPSWTILFEDGGDADFNDLVLTVNATQ